MILSSHIEKSKFYAQVEVTQLFNIGTYYQATKVGS